MYTYLQTHTRKLPRERPVLILTFTLVLVLSSIDMFQVYLIGIPHFTDTLYVYEKRWVEGVGSMGVGVAHLIMQGGFGGRLVQVSLRCVVWGAGREAEKEADGSFRWVCWGAVG